MRQPTGIIERCLHHLVGHGALDLSAVMGLRYKLTRAEAELVQHLSAGATAEEFAEQRQVALATVKGHLASGIRNSAPGIWFTNAERHPANQAWRVAAPVRWKYSRLPQMPRVQTMVVTQTTIARHQHHLRETASETAWTPGALAHQATQVLSPTRGSSSSGNRCRDTLCHAGILPYAGAWASKRHTQPQRVVNGCVYVA